MIVIKKEFLNKTFLNRIRYSKINKTKQYWQGTYVQLNQYCNLGIKRTFISKVKW